MTAEKDYSKNNSNLKVFEFDPNKLDRSSILGNSQIRQSFNTNEINKSSSIKTDFAEAKPKPVETTNEAQDSLTLSSFNIVMVCDEKTNANVYAFKKILNFFVIS